MAPAAVLLQGFQSKHSSGDPSPAQSLAGAVVGGIGGVLHHTPETPLTPSTAEPKACSELPPSGHPSLFFFFFLKKILFGEILCSVNKSMGLELIYSSHTSRSSREAQRWIQLAKD